MITDEQIVKDWNIFKRCDNCAYRGATTCKNSGDGPIHECWCHLDGNPGPLHDLYGAGCERWELASRFNHEEDAE